MGGRSQGQPFGHGGPHPDQPQEPGAQGAAQDAGRHDGHRREGRDAAEVLAERQGDRHGHRFGLQRGGHRPVGPQQVGQGDDAHHADEAAHDGGPQDGVFFVADMFEVGVEQVTQGDDGKFQEKVEHRVGLVIGLVIDPDEPEQADEHGHRNEQRVEDGVLEPAVQPQGSVIDRHGEGHQEKFGVE